MSYKLTKVLFIGGSGLLGKYFIENLPYNTAVYSTYYKHRPNITHKSVNFIKLDINNNTRLEKIIKDFQPDNVIHAACISNIDQCQQNKRLATKVNYIGTKKLIDILKNYPSKLIYLSSSNVYQGTKNIYKEIDNLHPVNHYGQTKKMSEKYITENSKEYIILRPTTMYGWGFSFSRDNIATKLINNLHSNRKIRFVNDRYTNFLYAKSLVSLINHVVISDIKNSIVNVAGNNSISYYNFILELCKIFSISQSCLMPAKSSYFKLKAKRPKKLNLSTTAMKKIFNFVPISVKQGLISMKNDKK
jgi:dTDP-4-dehydrorhamnose reductase